MNHPLDGARLKVVRAQEHLDALKCEISQYVQTRPYEIVAEEHGHIWEFSVRITREPPPRLSLLIGDCMSSLRTALDYIIWSLADRHAGRDLVIGSDRPYFPVYDDSVVCSNKLHGLAKRYSIPANALTEIEAVQPYHAGYELLRLLHAAVNQNEHRLLLLTTGHALSGEYEIWPEGYPSAIRIRGTAAAFLETTIPTSGDAEPALVRRNVDVKGEASIHVALKDFVMPWAFGPVDRVLERTVECVANIVPRFDPFV